MGSGNGNRDSRADDEHDSSDERYGPLATLAAKRLGWLTVLANALIAAIRLPDAGYLRVSLPAVLHDLPSSAAVLHAVKSVSGAAVDIRVFRFGLLCEPLRVARVDGGRVDVRVGVDPTIQAKRIAFDVPPDPGVVIAEVVVMGLRL